MQEPDSTRSPAGLPRYQRLLDLRFVLAALFTIFGVLVTATGLLATEDQLEKASGINISLWTGIALLLIAAVFGWWLIKAPPEVPRSRPTDENDDDHA